MADSQVRKLEAERDRLNAELKTLSGSITTKAACEDLIAYVEKNKEPFSADLHQSNPWAVSSPGGGGCCTIM